MNANAFVYFIKPVGMHGPIKIGCSATPIGRLATLSTWSPFPLEIIVSIPGGIKLERNIHECFAELHSHREWFHPGQRLIDAVDRIKQGIPVENAINLSDRRGSIVSKRCGGAGWGDITRQKMSILARVRGALKKIGINNQFHATRDVRLLMSQSGERILTPEEMATIKHFTDNPSLFKEECVTAYSVWTRKSEPSRPADEITS